MIQYICKKCSARIEKLSETDYQCVACGAAHRIIEDRQGTPKGFILNEREPLALPKGSVRAFITIAMGGFAIYFAAVSSLPAGLLQSFLTIVFYYFGFRKKDKYITVGGTKVKADVREPLYLPQGSIRFVILCIGVATFALIGPVQVVSNPDLLIFYYSFGGLLLGYWIARGILSAMSRENLKIVNDAKAVVAIAAVVYLGLNLFYGVDFLPEGVEYAVITFYFGSRK